MMPNFIIAGATRSGTTSLYYYLNQHPEISFPLLKEPRYFSSIHLTLPQNGPGDNTVDKKLITNLKDYQDLYKNIENKLVGDASSEYLYHFDRSAEEIKKVLGDIPIIIILRDPVGRAYSAYNNLVRDGREKLTFEDAIQMENSRINDNWDMMWAYKSVGMYSKQVSKFITIFSKVKILIFEEFIDDPQSGIIGILNFLNANPEVKIDTDTKYSHSGKPKNKIIGLITNRKNPLFYCMREILMEIIPRKYLEKISLLIFDKGNISYHTKKILYSSFKQDIEDLESIINHDLAIWKNY